VPVDTIELDNAVFTALSAEPLGIAAFVANTAGIATNAAQRSIYDTDNGALFYDADGSGGGSAAIRFATLTGGLSLTNADFTVV
jgi:serralysin